MPIVTNGSTPPPTVREEVSPHEYNTSSSSGMTAPSGNTLRHKAGITLTGDYYRQILGTDDPVKQYDINVPISLQQYEVTRDYECKVVDELTVTTVTTTGDLSLTMTVNIFGPFVPNVMDLIKMTLPDNHIVVFSIGSLDTLSYMHDRVYAAHLTSIIKTPYTDDHRLTNIEDKSVREFFFDKDAHTGTAVPVLSSYNHNVKDILTGFKYRMIDYYMDTFYSEKFKTLMVPTDVSDVYDQYIIRYVLSILNTDDHPNIAGMSNYDVDLVDNKETIWDLLRDTYKNKLRNMLTRNDLLSTRSLPSIYANGSIKYTAIRHVIGDGGTSLLSMVDNDNLTPSVFSVDSNVFIPNVFDRLVLGDNYYFCNGILEYTRPLVSFISPSTVGVDLDNSNLLIDGVSAVPDITNGYVFPESFYEGWNSHSVLEKVTNDYIKGCELNSGTIMNLCERYHFWSELQQFYYIPILITLITQTIKGTYGYR